MRDKEGKAVADPCSWVFQSLARQGYYRRPNGYVSPEEQAETDAAAAAKALLQAQKARKDVEFEAWRAGLPPEELAAILAGKTVRYMPDEQYLRAQCRRARGSGRCISAPAPIARAIARLPASAAAASCPISWQRPVARR